MKFATTTTLLASTAAAIKMKAPVQKSTKVNFMKLQQDEYEEDADWLNYGFDT